MWRGKNLVIIYIYMGKKKSSNSWIYIQLSYTWWGVTFLLVFLCYGVLWLFHWVPLLAFDDVETLSSHMTICIWILLFWHFEFRQTPILFTSAYFLLVSVKFSFKSVIDFVNIYNLTIKNRRRFCFSFVCGVIKRH